ncbi:hypothetical protein [Streptomyces sp. NPDC088923]|uniref:hypothetical protein n=1 Tax=Streptomyces sp. NPDC088923 TaxID=3365913 RepID=UPI0038082F41
MVTGAPAPPMREAATVSAADDTPGYAVEDFASPRADEILAEKGLVPKRGDGHVALADRVAHTGQPLSEHTWTPVGESADPENRDVPPADLRTSA